MKWYYYLIPFIPQTILRILTKVFVLIFLRPKMIGLENLEKTGGSFILASNHTNEFDPVILLSTFPFRSFFRPVFFVSLSKKYYLKRGLRAKLLYGGLLFWLLGAEPVYLGVKDYEKSLKNHVRILENGGVTYIFPEGRVVKPGEEKSAKPGISYLSFRTKSDILPVFISGNNEKNFWKELFLFKRKIKVVIGEPLQYKDLFKGKAPNLEDYKKISQKILDGIKSLDNRSPQNN